MRENTSPNFHKSKETAFAMTSYDSTTKLAVRDSFDDDDASDDVDDEVFIRDGRNGFKVDDESGVKRPLMAPRRKCAKNGHLHAEVRKVPPCKVLCAPCCYAVIALSVLLGLIVLVVYLINTFSFSFGHFTFWKPKPEKLLVPCNEISVEDVWTMSFPKMLSRTAFRLNDINKDGIVDVIFGFGTGADGLNLPDFVCDLYFAGKKPCFGGVLALDGKSGDVIWEHLTQHEVYAVNCGADLTDDGTNDCLIMGRGGVFCAVNGHDGSLVWQFKPYEGGKVRSNFFTATFIEDLNGDGVLDVLASHGTPLKDGVNRHHSTGPFFLLNGKDGQILQAIHAPNNSESYYTPQILVRPNGEEIVLFGTGRQTHSGALYVVPLHELAQRKIEKAKTIYVDKFNGILTSPILADINQDGTEDIIMAMFNSTVIAFDGYTFEVIWNYTFPSSESLNIPGAGYFDGDNIPDFLVQYQTGQGYPLYFYSQTVVLSGKTGQPLHKPIVNAVGSHGSSVTISMEELGDDLFLYWSSDCKGHEGSKEPYGFVKGPSAEDQGKYDLCKLRFKAKKVSKLFALRHQGPLPGVEIYNSEMRQNFEYSNFINTSREAQRYLKMHPDFWEKYRDYKVKDFQDTFEDRDYSGTNVDNMNEESPSNRNQYQQGMYYDNVNRNGYLPPDGRRIPLRMNQQGMLPHQQFGEQTETIPYPAGYHNVRKHGKFNYHPHPDVDHASDWQLPQDSSDWSQQGNIPYQNMNGPQNYDANRDYVPYAYDTPAAGSDRDWNQNIYNRKWSKRGSSFQDQPRAIHYTESTGTLAPPVTSMNHSIDFIFAAYWVFPSKKQFILTRDQDCIQQRLADDDVRFDKTSKYHGMDRDTYEAQVTKECLGKSESDQDADEYDMPTDDPDDPFSLEMGQMTVYRLKIKCTCSPESIKNGKKCATILPYEQQSWPSYMGAAGNSYFKPRHV